MINAKEVIKVKRGYKLKDEYAKQSGEGLIRDDLEVNREQERGKKQVMRGFKEEERYFQEAVRPNQRR